MTYFTNSQNRTYPNQNRAPVPVRVKEPQTLAHPSMMPYNVPMTVSEQYAGSIPYQTACLYNSMARSYIQSKCGENPAWVILYDMLSENNFDNYEYGTFLTMVNNNVQSRRGDTNYYSRDDGEVLAAVDKACYTIFDEVKEVSPEVATSLTPMMLEKCRMATGKRPAQQPSYGNYNRPTQAGYGYGAPRQKREHASSFDFGMPEDTRPGRRVVKQDTFNMAVAERPVPAPMVVQDKNVSDAQWQILQKYFDGKKPEGTRTIRTQTHAKGRYAFPAEAVKDFPRARTNLISYDEDGRVISMGQHPSLWDARTSDMYYTLTESGEKVECILRKTKEDEMNVDDHVLPGAIVKWDAVVDVESSENDTLICETPMIGSIASGAVGSKYIAACEGGDTDPAERVIEYTANDPKGFFVKDRRSAMRVLSGRAKVKYTSMAGFVKAVNETDDLDAGLLAHLTKRSTQIVNDYLAYSMGISLAIDDLFEDWDDLVDAIAENYGDDVVDILHKNELALVRKMAAVYTYGEMGTMGYDLPYEAPGEETEGKDAKAVEKERKAILDGLLLVSSPIQVTSVPWTFDKTWLKMEAVEGVAAHGLIVANLMPELQAAAKALFERAKDQRTFAVQIVTADDVTLTVHRSAYDDESFIIVKAYD